LTPRSETKSEWQQVMIFTILLFPSFSVTVIAILNTISIYYDTIGAIPFVVILKMCAIWLFVSVPLTIVGTIFGRHWLKKSDIPCRINSIPRYKLYSYLFLSA
jgi:hypothetical protein